jgi:SAM-dependent methyltransferase
MNKDERHKFLTEYAIIRCAEGRGSADAAYYRELPYRDLTGKNTAQWKIRARTFRHFQRTVLARIEKQFGCPLDVLDLGAGNGWLSYRLACHNHHPVALDVFCDQRDGLGALPNYPIPIPAVSADFDNLPFRDSSFDLAIYNSSLHYSPNYGRTLTELRRCLRPSGRFVIMDSPVYARREHGEMMRAERREFFQKRYGFRSDALGSIEYIDSAMLERLAHELGIRWELFKPWYGLRWALRPWRAKLRGRRPPSRFIILAGSFEPQ